MTAKTFGITEVFYTLQGEGINAGVPAVFLRFAGCNLDCDFTPSPRSPGGWKCDTDFGLRERLTPDELVTRCLSVLQGGPHRR
jgi:organic radical activating enzyme